MTEPAATYTTQILPASVVLAVPYTCQHCGAHLGQLVWYRGRTCLDRGLPMPDETVESWCINPACGKQYHYHASKETPEFIAAMRERREMAKHLVEDMVVMVETKYQEEKG
jgi:hypothetical protein